MKTLAIFDLDGTLVNSIPDLGNACNYALEQMGFPTHSLAIYRSMVGNGTSKLIERALPEDSRRPQVIEAMRKIYMEYYDNHLWDASEVYPGIREVLEMLSRRNMRLAVASNKYQSATSRIIEHFFPEIPWAVVMGSRDRVPLKPDPSVVFNILLECPTPKSEVIYIGDSGIDMETAYRACVDSIGVTWGFRTRSELINAHADNIVKEPVEILEIIKSYNRD